MNPGRLNSPLDLLQATSVRDSSGGDWPVWSVIDSLWANVKPLSSDRKEVAHAFAAISTHQIEIRFNDQIKTIHRLRRPAGSGGTGGSGIFIINGIWDPDDAGRRMFIAATELIS
jgi:SPP1 family predicted phage head-tail adaptor